MWGWFEAGQDLGFALEAGEALGVRSDGLGQDLDGHLATELGVFGAIHGPHAAFAQLGGDPEMREGRADHRVGRPAQGRGRFKRHSVREVGGIVQSLARSCLGFVRQEKGHPTLVECPAFAVVGQAVRCQSTEF